MSSSQSFSARKKISVLSILAGFAFIAACVTINVYFPTAAAEEAADRFIEDVIGDEMPGPRDDSDATESDAMESGNDSGSFPAPQAGVLDFFISSAHAQDDVNIDISTPAIQEIQARMRQRHQQHLAAFFDAGAIGLTNDAMVAVRDKSAVSLKDRNQLDAMVAEENRDRAAVYREIAKANGHPEWEDQIRATFARQWIANAKTGWYYQKDGDWVQK